MSDNSKDQEDTAKRRDAVALRMLKTKPKPHKDEPKRRAASKKKPRAPRKG